MARYGIVSVASACALVAILAMPAGVSAQAGTAPKAGATSNEKKSTGDQAAAKKPMGEKMASGSSIASVHIPRKVTADGQGLAAGTYSLRVSEEAVKPVVGQTPAETKWVEFVQGGWVKGREIATVLTAAEAKQVAKQALPSAGAAKVEMLKGDDYLRVWVNMGGTNYLIHLASAPM